MSFSTLKRKRMAGCVVAVVVILWVVMAGLSYLPTSRDKMDQSVAMMECRSYYAVRADGKPLFCFQDLTSDTLFSCVDTAAVEIARVSYAPACWVNASVFIPSCKGRLVTCMSGNGDSVRAVVAKHGDRIVAHEIAVLEREEKALEHKASELKYYLNVHGVQDEGFNSVSKYAVKVNHEKDSVSHILSRLRQLRQNVRLDVSYVTDYTLLVRSAKGKLERKPCRPLSSRDAYGFVLVQTKDATTPDGACAQNLHNWLPWKAAEGDLIFVPGYGGMSRPAFDACKAIANLTPGHVTDATGKHNIPQLLAPDGSPVYSQNGCFVGLTCQGRVIDTKTLARLFKTVK